MKFQEYTKVGKDMIMLKNGAIFHLHFGVGFLCGRLRYDRPTYGCMKCGKLINLKVQDEFVYYG